MGAPARVRRLTRIDLGQGLLPDPADQFELPFDGPLDDTELVGDLRVRIRLDLPLGDEFERLGKRA